MSQPKPNNSASQDKSADRYQSSVRLIIGRGALLIGAALLCYSAYQGWRWYVTTHHTAALPAALKASQEVVTTSTDTPDETPITSDDYHVPADHPRQILIPSIGAKGFIQRVGVDQNNAVAVPTNVHLAGWFTDSSLPGQPGLSLVDGHVQGVYQPGIFKQLSMVSPGDTIEVEMGDLTKHRYEIIDIKTLTPEQTTDVQFVQLPNVSSQLNLITCGGTYDKATKQYDRRILVRAKLL